MEGLAVYFVGAVICGIVAACIAHSKRRNTVAWFLAGLLGGIVGVIIIAIRSSKETLNSQKPQQLEHTQNELKQLVRTMNNETTVHKEELLQDVIPPPQEKEQKIRLYGGRYQTTPEYTVWLKPEAFIRYPNSGLCIQGRYVEICRIPIKDVEKVQLQTRKSWPEVIFKNWD